MLKGRGDQNMSRYHLKNTIDKDTIPKWWQRAIGKIYFPCFCQPCWETLLGCLALVLG